MKRWRWIGVVVGLGMVTLLLRAVGWPAVRQTLEWLGWGYAIVLVYPLSWILLNAFSWQQALPLGQKKVPFFRLTAMRMAGESFNSLLPSGYVGGEPLKARLLADWMPASEAASSVLVAKAAQSVAMVIFAVLGLAAGRPSGASLYPPRAMTAALVALTLGIGLFTALLARGSFASLGRALHRITRVFWLQRQDERLIALDASLGEFYRHGKRRFLASVLWSVAAWLAGALELWIIFHLIGHPIAWRQAWFMGALAQVASVVGLFSPGGVGFYEGGHFLAARLLGLPPALGLSVSLIRRVREIFWDGVGVGIFWRLAAKTTKS